MTIVGSDSGAVIGGVDPHADVHVAAAANHVGGVFPLLQAHLPRERGARVQQRHRRRTFVSRDGVRSATCGATAEAATGLDR